MLHAHRADKGVNRSRWRALFMLSPKIEESDSTSEYSDDDAVGQGLSEPESKPILPIRECLYWEKKKQLPLISTGMPE